YSDSVFVIGISNELCSEKRCARRREKERLHLFAKITCARRPESKSDAGSRELRSGRSGPSAQPSLRRNRSRGERRGSQPGTRGRRTYLSGRRKLLRASERGTPGFGKRE